MNKAIFTLLIILSVPSVSKSEILADSASQQGDGGAILRSGQCVLTVQNLYKKVSGSSDASKWELIPLESAKQNPSCPKIRDNSKILAAYAEIEAREKDRIEEQQKLNRAEYQNCQFFFDGLFGTSSIRLLQPESMSCTYFKSSDIANSYQKIWEYVCSGRRNDSRMILKVTYDKYMSGNKRYSGKLFGGTGLEPIATRCVPRNIEELRKEARVAKEQRQRLCRETGGRYLFGKIDCPPGMDSSRRFPF